MTKKQTCTLKLHSTPGKVLARGISRRALALVAEAISGVEEDPREAVAWLEGEQGTSHHIPTNDHGMIPAGLEAALQNARMSYSWSCQKCRSVTTIEIYDGTAHASAEFHCVNGRIVLPAEASPVDVAKARTWQALLDSWAAEHADREEAV